MLRRCLGPNTATPCPYGSVTPRTRCERCQRERDATRRPSTAQRGYGAEWQAFSKGAIAAEPWCHSQPCPYPDAGTPDNPLTTDHVTLGLVLCRRCNSSKQHRDRTRG